MTAEILVNVTPRESRAAFLENGVLQEVHIERAISWREEVPFAAANAEQFGQQLRDRLQAAGIAAAPLIVGLGRDRMVVKEIRFPQVPPEVEAS